MIKVSVTKQSNYPVAANKIKKLLTKFFAEHGIVSDGEVSVAIVGERKMMEVGKKYLNDGKLHNVFSFTPSETKGNFVYPPGGPLQLGEIMVCYPVVVKESQVENVLIEKKVLDLVEHSALHLLGIHHK